MNDVMNAQYKLDVKKQVYDNYNRNLTDDENKKLKQINKNRAKICNDDFLQFNISDISLILLNFKYNLTADNL